VTLTNKALLKTAMAGSRLILASILAFATSLKLAVLEHQVRQRHDGASTMAANLDVFQREVKRAAASGVQVMVTPEYGLTGFPGADRSWWWDYAVDIPDLDTSGSHPNPCLEVSHFPHIITELSCLARDNHVVLIVGLIDMKDCSRPGSPLECRWSRDGWLLFNTVLAFDSDGAYLAKYHKANLWGENAVDPGKDCKLAEFVPKEIKLSFGLFVCADLIHAWPALDLVSRGIRHFVMPLSWSNEMSQMQPLPWIQAWSKAMNVTIAAANARSQGSESGSGIFANGVVMAQAYNLETDADELVMASVQEESSHSPPKVCPVPSQQVQAMRPHWSQWLSYQLNMSKGNHSISVCSNYQPGFSDGPTCCSLSYTSKAEGKGYVLAVLNGLDLASGIESWAGEACAVLPCPADGVTDCLSYPTSALAKHGPNSFGQFSKIDLTVKFSMPQMVFPQVLAGPRRLLDPAQWHWETAGLLSRVMLSDEAAGELISLQLYGRPYSKDPDSDVKCPCEPADIWS